MGGSTAKYLICLLNVLEVVARGKGIIQFISYHNPTHMDDRGQCCESTSTSGCSPGQCDPYFHICVGRVGSSSCEYGQTTTRAFDNTDDIDFGHTIGTMPNPIRIANIAPWGHGVYIDVNVTDRDIGNSDDLIGQTIYRISSPVFTNGTIPHNTTETIRFGAAQLVIQYSFVCDRYYFGDCATYCHPMSPPQFTCSAGGAKKCLSEYLRNRNAPVTTCSLCPKCRSVILDMSGDIMTSAICGTRDAHSSGTHDLTFGFCEGWTGSQCNIRHRACTSNPCANNATCSDVPSSNLYRCTCLNGWTGKDCRNEIVTSLVNSTPIRTTSAAIAMTSTTQKPMTSTHMTSRTLTTSQTTTGIHTSQMSDQPTTISGTSSATSSSISSAPSASSTSTTSDTQRTTDKQLTSTMLQTSDPYSTMAVSPRHPTTTIGTNKGKSGVTSLQTTSVTSSRPRTSANSTWYTTSATQAPTHSEVPCAIKITASQVNAGTVLVDISGFDKKSLTDGDIQTTFGQLIPPSDLHQVSANDTFMVYEISTVHNASTLEKTTLSKVELVLCHKQTKVPTEPKSRRTKQDGENSSNIGGIVGGVVGGLILIQTLGTVIFVLYRRWRNMKFNQITDQTNGNTSRSTRDTPRQRNSRDLHTTNPSDKHSLVQDTPILEVKAAH